MNRSKGVVAGVVLASTTLYFAWSEGVRAETHRLTSDYTRFLIEEFASGRHYGIFPELRIDLDGVIGMGALILLCIGAAILMRRAVGSTGQDFGPELIVYGSTAVVVPAQVIAIVFWPDGRGRLTSTNWIMVTAAGIGLGLLIALRKGPTRTTASRPILRGWAVPFTAGAILITAVSLIYGLSTIRGIDSYTYHLPRAASWLRHSTLTTNVEECLFFFFPGNAELFVRWFVAATDRLAFLFAFATSALSIYVLYKICLEVKQPREIAAVAALCAASCVMLSFIGTGVYVDSFVALHLLLAVLFLLRWIKAERTAGQTLVPMSLALGIALGTKYAAIPAVLVIAGVWLWYVARKNMDRYAGCMQILDYRALARAALPVAGIAAIPSVYWYARNLIEHANPVFPVAILGMPGMPMDVMIATSPALDDPLQRLLFLWHEAGYIALEDVLGAVFAGVAVPGLVLAPAHFKRRPVATLWWITVGSLSLWLLTGNLVLRYGLFPLLLTYVFVGELWIAYGSPALRLITMIAFSLTILLFSASYAVQTMYTAVAGQPNYGVPPEINGLPPGRVFNAISHDANYGCMGSDYRHDVICVYFEAQPDHLRRLRPDYVLLHESQVAAFSAAAVLERVARSRRDDGTETSLWRVRTLR